MTHYISDDLVFQAKAIRDLTEAKQANVAADREALIAHYAARVF